MGRRDKASLHRVALTNTDPTMIKIFMIFLKDVAELRSIKLKHGFFCIQTFMNQHARNTGLMRQVCRILPLIKALLQKGDTRQSVSDTGFVLFMFLVDILRKNVIVDFTIP